MKQNDTAPSDFIREIIKSENVENNSEREMEMVPGNWTWYNRPA
ncbi:MAG: hypothetical protein WBF05_13455 [Anaerolineales bacterium]